MKTFARIIFVSSIALVLAGCNDAAEKAESIGVIGGEDGPTAVWITTRLPWSNGEPIILRGTNGTRNCVFDDNGVAVPMRKGGAAQIVKGKYINRVAYTNKQLAQRGTIHVIKPTGRVSVVCAPLSK